MSDKQEMTAEEYKLQIMKRNTANRFVEYEEQIANLQTQVAMLQQQLQQSTEVRQESNELVAPPPPVVDEDS